MIHRILVVDDEPLARSSITTLLAADPGAVVVGECASGAEAVQAARELKPDILILDIKLPDFDGFEVLEQLGANAPKAVVFVTAYDQYAIKAFEAHALDYLLKPFEDARFALALERAKANVRQSRPDAGRIVLRESGRITLIEVASIDWIEAQDYYACLHVGSKTHLLRKTLGEFEAELAPLTFCRVHRSAIVNIQRVTALQLDSAGEYEILLSSGQKLRLSRTYRKQLQSRLASYSKTADSKKF